MKKLLPVGLLAAALSLPAGAQCVMCYRTAHAQNQARSRVLDTGILILGAPPFLILAGFIAFVFSKDKQFREDESGDSILVSGTATVSEDVPPPADS